jgi:hypothetical protein
MMHIPKVIHYCWFGGNPLPESAKKCIESWKIYFPDYEIKEWNESNFDINIISYTAEAYKEKKYAFVSDYARFYILYKYGGLYFDTDVEVISNMDDIVAQGPFMGCENDVIPGADPESLGVAPGLGLGSYPGHSVYKEILDMYSDLHFIVNGELNLKTVVSYTTEILSRHGLKAVDGIQQCCGISIYPKEYFCPKDYSSNVLTITSNTRTIHHYTGTWMSFGRRLKLFRARMIKRLNLTGLKNFINKLRGK